MYLSLLTKVPPTRYGATMVRKRGLVQISAFEMEGNVLVCAPARKRTCLRRGGGGDQSTVHAWAS